MTKGLDPNELPGDELRRVLDQMCEHGESLGPERNLLRALPELRVCRVETKSAKAQRLALLHYQNITGT